MRNVRRREAPGLGVFPRNPAPSGLSGTLFIDINTKLYIGDSATLSIVLLSVPPVFSTQGF
jgi:hypothetical protein